jgi:hypothetical protein
MWIGWTLCQLLSYRAAYTTPAPMKQGQVFGGKRQVLSINQGQVNHVEAEVEPEELEN